MLVARLQAGPQSDFPDNQGSCEAPKQGDQISKFKSLAMPFLGDIKIKEALFHINFLQEHGKKKSRF